MKPRERAAAKKAGEKTYVTGKPCKWGHAAPRRTSTGHCSVCEVEQQRAYRTNNLEEVRARERRWYHRKHLPTPTRPKPPRCELCDCLPQNNALNLDHCHETGAFRGWLCLCCNMALGKLGDNLEGLRKAQAYLERFHSSNT